MQTFDEVWDEYQTRKMTVDQKFKELKSAKLLYSGALLKDVYKLAPYHIDKMLSAMAYEDNFLVTKKETRSGGGVKVKFFSLTRTVAEGMRQFTVRSGLLIFLAAFPELVKIPPPSKEHDAYSTTQFEKIFRKKFRVDFDTFFFNDFESSPWIGNMELVNKLSKYILVKENGDEVLVPMVTVEEDEKPTRKGKGKKKQRSHQPTKQYLRMVSSFW